MVRRYTIFIFLILILVLGGMRVWAQGTPPQPTPTSEPLIVAHPPSQMIAGSEERPSISLDPINPPAFDNPFAINAASDSCTDATTINIPGGDQITITDLPFTQDASDPILSCMWGTPSAGYRTAWYKFTAASSGSISIDTFGSNYDTVLAVWKDISSIDVLDPCIDFSVDMQMVTCVDDSRGFPTDTTITVREGETYYIEVADWEDAAPSPKTLQIIVERDPINSNWALKASMPTALSRHATAVAGNNIYVIGGQISEIGTVDITSSLRRYDTIGNQWATLQNMPGPGYSNTTAAYVDGPTDNGRIYVPSGYTGGETYDMTHWAYDIQGHYWLTRTAITEAIATTPFAWASTVALTNGNGYYVIGGLNTTGSPTGASDVRKEMYFYSPIIDNWLPRTSMNDARYAHTAALINNKICVVGGLKHDGINLVLLPDGECYDQGTGIWSIIAPMNVPRYMAASAVGPDGKWYVFGGLDANNDAVAETEVYDPASDTWTVLPVGDDLGGSESLPARAWPRGGLVGSTLYAMGGNTAVQGQLQYPLALVESTFLPSNEILLPVIMSNYGDFYRPDDNFAEARPLAFNVPQYRNFNNSADYFDVYYFDLSTQAVVTVHLDQVPNDSNYDVFVYNSSKDLRGTGDNVFLGMSESVRTPL
ncbi:MAG: kelch repeat-containing protein, partial [Anaerolineae bacterium]